MSRVFKVWPKRVKRVNGTVLTPEMVIVVTTKIHVSNPFSNGAQEIKDTCPSGCLARAWMPWERRWR